MLFVEVLSQVRRTKKQIICLKPRTITKHPPKDLLEEDKVESWSWTEFHP